MDIILPTESELLIILGNRLREQRLLKNWLQKTLAEKAGISISALKKLESTGKGTLENFMKVVYALRLEKELLTLFVPQVMTIAQLEALPVVTRKRARQLSRTKRG